MKKVLAIMAGPRKRYNTDFALDTFIEGIEASGEVKVEKVYLIDLKIGHCIGCTFCSRMGKCFQNDDMQPLYDKFNESEGIILASPIFFDGITSFGKTMIDRCQVYWTSKYVLKKPAIDRNKKRFGALIITGGAPDEEHKFIGCDQVGSMFFRAINTDIREKIFYADSDKMPTWKNKDFKNEVFEKGKNFLKEF